MGFSDRTVLVTGWVPAVLARQLESAVRAATDDRCLLEWREPETVDGVKRGRIPVPILMRNPVLFRPFERLLRAYGMPRYREIEPTAVAALGFLTMFGFMFGDVGQGAVLFGVGYFVYRRMFRHRDYALILMECGVFAMIFGVLYGSVFGSERVIPALWLHPMKDVPTLMRAAIGFGAAFVSLGFALNVINAVRRRDASALWGHNGLLPALVYWVAAALLLRSLVGGPETIVLGTGLLWLSLPMALILAKGPARIAWRGLRGDGWPAPAEIASAVLESGAELLDSVVSTIANTATFVRLAAFALSHAALLLATFSVADVVASSGGSLAALPVIALGNVLVIVLEGVIVAIQGVRLEYYEFFSKFYGGEGEEYRPLRYGRALDPTRLDRRSESNA
jgi:V/A-type H+-transporting ATPase subunit I